LPQPERHPGRERTKITARDASDSRPFPIIARLLPDIGHTPGKDLDAEGMTRCGGTSSELWTTAAGAVTITACSLPGEELDMTTVAGEFGLPPELLLLDGALVVNPPPGFTHEDLLMDLPAQLRTASPADIAVFRSGFKFFYAATTDRRQHDQPHDG
jgi:hypothetical protein